MNKFSLASHALALDFIQHFKKMVADGSSIKYFLLSFLLGFSPVGYGQIITIDPNNSQHTVSSHIIGTQRNHTFNEVDPSLSNGQDAAFYDKLDEYGKIVPNFGDKRKIYRLGGTDIDGSHNLDYPGYHWATEYKKGNISWAVGPPTSALVSSSSPAYWGEVNGTKTLGAGVHRVLYYAPNGEFSGFTITVNYPQEINLGSISCPDNIYRTELNNNVTWLEPTANSNCGEVTVNQTSGPISGSNNFPIGIREIDYRFTDPCGSVSYCSFLVVVNKDTIPPAVNKLQNNIMVELPNQTTHNIPVTWQNHQFNGEAVDQYYVPNYDDLSYYLDDATRMNADLSVGVNVGSGHPLEAAGLVQKLINTGDIDRVAYFELGNETSLSPVWGGTKGHPCTPEAYASFAAQFVRAASYKIRHQNRCHG